MTRYYNSSKHFRRISSVPHHIFNIFCLTLFALATLFVSSCEEDPTKIGNELLPGKDFVEIKSADTIRVWSYTDINDSTRTDNPNVSFLGQIRDPYFGTTTTEFVTQIRLRSAWDDKPFVIDSVKLSLRLYHINGGTTDEVYTLTLSEIADQIYIDSAYYSNKPVNTTGYSLSVPLPKLAIDSLNDINIDLPVSFGEYLTRDTSQFFYSNTKPDFRSYFKGLYFQISTSSDPLMVSLSLSAQSTASEYYNYITLFMHDADGQKEYYLILDATNANARYNRYIHDLSTADSDKRIKHVNDDIKDTLSYLQYLNGVYTKITFPGLENLKNNPEFAKIAINKARLTIPVFFDGDTYKASKVPESLRLRFKSSNGLKYDVPDYYIDESHQFFDGTLDSVKNVYNFNIPNFVQGYLRDATGTIKPELEVFQSTTDTKNAIFKANNNKTPVKFEFTYTKF